MQTPTPNKVPRLNTYASVSKLNFKSGLVKPSIANAVRTDSPGIRSNYSNNSNSLLRRYSNAENGPNSADRRKFGLRNSGLKSNYKHYLYKTADRVESKQVTISLKAE